MWNFRIVNADHVPNPGIHNEIWVSEALLARHLLRCSPIFSGHYKQTREPARVASSIRNASIGGNEQFVNSTNGIESVTGEDGPKYHSEPSSLTMMQ